MNHIRPLVLVALCSLPLLIHGADFTVDTTQDAVDVNLGDGLCETATQQCSLRAAVQEANALAGEDVINLPAGVYNLTLHGVAENLSASGDLDILSTLTIQGAGADKTFVDGMGQDRVFHVVFDRRTRILSDATINALTIRNGNANTSFGSDNMGGGIRSEAVLRLNDCNIDRNFSYAGGGGVYASHFGFPALGYLEINRCNITHNSDSGFGGGVSANDVRLVLRDSVISGNKATAISGSVFGGGLHYADSNFLAPLTSQVSNTTIMNNSALTQGGGVYVMYGQLGMSNSTISGNLAYGQGGGMFVASNADVTLSNLTITNNQAQIGGGLFLGGPSATAQISDSIIAVNPQGSNCVSHGVLNLNGQNLDSDNSCGASLNGLDPLLGALADNGGPGHTHVLLADSPARDVATLCPVTDQRAYLRPTQACDLGAIDMEGTAPASEISTPALNTGTSSDGANLAPTAWGLPYAISAGGVLQGIMNGYDPDGDRIIYEFPLNGPSKGSVAIPEIGSANAIPEGFTYTPHADATGYDSFSYRICDSRGACSQPATINILIAAPTPINSAINVALTASAGNTNDLVIVSESELNAIAPDVDYNYPIGAYFFDVVDIPTNGAGDAQETVIVIQLPIDAELSQAVVRKIDNTGTWQTLGSVIDPTVSSAVIDPIAKTITLTLRDNDIFDGNPQIGVISDPIAIGFSASATPVEPPAPTTPTSHDAAAKQSLSGGGAFNLLVLLLVLWLTRYRARFLRLTHNNTAKY